LNSLFKRRWERVTRREEARGGNHGGWEAIQEVRTAAREAQTALKNGERNQSEKEKTSQEVEKPNGKTKTGEHHWGPLM